jgi:hypothetical protein
MKFSPFLNLILYNKKTLFTIVPCLFFIFLIKKLRIRLSKQQKKADKTKKPKKSKKNKKLKTVKKGNKSKKEKKERKEQKRTGYLKAIRSKVYVAMLGYPSKIDDCLTKIRPDLPPISFVAYGVVPPFQLIMREILK